jgi:hypothetical protein
LHTPPTSLRTAYADFSLPSYPCQRKFLGKRSSASTHESILPFDGGGMQFILDGPSMEGCGSRRTMYSTMAGPLTPSCPLGRMTAKHEARHPFIAWGSTGPIPRPDQSSAGRGRPQSPGRQHRRPIRPIPGRVPRREHGPYPIPRLS